MDEPHTGKKSKKSIRKIKSKKKPEQRSFVVEKKKRLVFFFAGKVSNE